MFGWLHNHGYDDSDNSAGYYSSDVDDDDGSDDFYLGEPHVAARERTPEVNDEDIAERPPALDDLEGTITGKKRDLDTLRDERNQLQLQLNQLTNRLVEGEVNLEQLERERKRLRLELRRPEKKKRDEVASRVRDVLNTYLTTIRRYLFTYRSDPDREEAVATLIASLRSIVDEHLGKQIVPGTAWTREDLLLLQTISQEIFLIMNHTLRTDAEFRKFLDELSGHWVSGMLWYPFPPEKEEDERVEWRMTLRKLDPELCDAAADATRAKWDDPKLLSILKTGSCTGRFEEHAKITLKRLEYLRLQGRLHECLNLGRHCGLRDQLVVDLIHMGDLEEAVSDCLSQEDLTPPQLVRTAETLDAAYARAKKKTSSLGFLKFQVLAAALQRAAQAYRETAVGDKTKPLIDTGMALFRMLPRSPDADLHRPGQSNNGERASTGRVPALYTLAAETAAHHFTDAVSFESMLADAVAMIRSLPPPLQDISVTPIAVQLVIRGYPTLHASSSYNMFSRAAEFFEEQCDFRSACYLMIAAMADPDYRMFDRQRKVLKYAAASHSARLQQDATARVVESAWEAGSTLSFAEYALTDCELPRAALALSRKAMELAQKPKRDLAQDIMDRVVALADRPWSKDHASEVRRFMLQKLLKYCTREETEQLVSTYMVEHRDCATAALCASELLTAGLTTEALRVSERGVSLSGHCNRWANYSKYVDLAVESNQPETALKICTEICTREPVKPALDRLQSLVPAASWPAKLRSVLEALRGRSFAVGGHPTRPVIDLFWEEGVPEFSKDVLSSAEDAAYVVDLCLKRPDLHLLESMFDSIAKVLVQDDYSSRGGTIDRTTEQLLATRPELAARLYEQRAQRRLEIVTPSMYSGLKAWLDEMKQVYEQHGMRAKYDQFFAALHKRFKGKKALWKLWGI